MDVQKTMEFILEQQAEAAVWRAKYEQELAATQASQRMTERTLRRAIRMGVQEARNQRARRQDLEARFEEAMTRLAAAQLLTEEKLQNLSATVDRLGAKVDRFIDGVHGGNGHS